MKYLDIAVYFFVTGLVNKSIRFLVHAVSLGFILLLVPPRCNSVDYPRTQTLDT